MVTNIFEAAFEGLKKRSPMVWKCPTHIDYLVRMWESFITCKYKVSLTVSFVSYIPILKDLLGEKLRFNHILSVLNHCSSLIYFSRKQFY